jgi:FkbM family methyltransferase
MFEKSRFLYRAWKYRARDDKAEINFLLSHVAKGDIVIDIGAHKGAYLYWLRKSVGPAGKVFAFEAQPLLATYLQRMTAFFKFKNVTVEWLGLSSKQGELELTIPNPDGSPSPGATFEQITTGTAPLYKEKVKVDTLDNYFSSADKRPVKFIKCDVEGHELEVFRGGEKILKKDMPILLFECEARHLQSGDVKEVFSFLEDLGYSGQFFANGKITSLDKFDMQKHQQIRDGKIIDHLSYCNNFVFMPKP